MSIRSSVLFTALAFTTAAFAQGFLTPALTPQQVSDRLDGSEPLLVVDIRKPAEFRAGHIPGAVNIPLKKLARRIDDLRTGNDVLIYCINGKRTREAEPLLLEQGVENLYHLEGAFFAWTRSGLEVEKGWTK